MSVLLNDGMSNVSLGGQYGGFPDGYDAGTIELVDLNLDGALDVVVSPGVCVGSIAIFVLLGDGEGGFEPAEPGWYLYDYSFCHTTVDDIDLDGNPDAFFHGCCGHLLFLGDGQGHLQQDYHYGFVQCWEAAVADFDLDGDLDYATGSTANGPVYLQVFLNKTITNGIEQQDENSFKPVIALLNSPVNSTASISVTLSEPGSCRLSAFDLNGRQIDIILDGTLPSGTTEMQWSTEHLSPGCYFLKLETGTGESAAARCLVVD